jgi:hypothetical protein
VLLLLLHPHPHHLRRRQDRHHYQLDQYRSEPLNIT